VFFVLALLPQRRQLDVTFLDIEVLDPKLSDGEHDSSSFANRLIRAVRSLHSSRGPFFHAPPLRFPSPPPTGSAIVAWGGAAVQLTSIAWTTTNEEETHVQRLRDSSVAWTPALNSRIFTLNF
jgi:hypothetical protein